MDAAEQWIALSDGGNSLEDFFEGEFSAGGDDPGLSSCNRLSGDLGQAGRSPQVAGTKCNGRLMSHPQTCWRGAELLTVWRKLDRGKMTETIEVEYDKILNYIRKNVHRMDYPTYLRRGWRGGSGASSSPRARPSSTNASVQGGIRNRVRKAPTGSPTYVLCTAAIPISGTDIGALTRLNDFTPQR